MSFYSHNGFFWVKMALFGGEFVLEKLYRRINSAELALVVTIVFVAAFMARGAWLF